MPSFNPLSIIMKDHKLDGTNYVNWKRNLDIVLTSEEYKFVLTEVCLELPEEGATDEQSSAHKKWKKADEMARCYMLASMSDVLQTQHQNMTSAYDIIYSLKEMFGDQGRVARQTAMKTLLNTQMKEEPNVSGHTLKMMSLLNELEVLGADIDGESQIDIVLQSLHDSYENFRLNYNMNKRLYTLPELLNELKGAKKLQPKQAKVNLNEKGSSTIPKGKKKRFQETRRPNKEESYVLLGDATKLRLETGYALETAA
ncbi:uncharacterized protein LOC119996956 [Tripterygium wilfordii]|uniref:uncharacterized protein LOC119996956 n=1 Tax=Tripterygium wilfordii TaxID=458696 RepID=UPI0018F809A4|nr:uncharacterized protein LOC119996956 [Tripterygium wilfordii]